MEEAVLRRLVKDREELEALLRELEGAPLYEQAERLLSLVGLAGKVLADLPEQQRGSFAPVVAQILSPLAGEGFKGRLERIAEAVAMIKAANQIASSDGTEKLLEEVRRLREELQSIQQERSRSEVEKLLQALDALQSGLADLVARVESLAAQRQEKRVEEKGSVANSFAERVAELKREVEALRDALQLLGYKVEAGGKSWTPEELAEELRKYGFRVERETLTPDEVKRMIEEREREIAERLKRELEVDKARIQEVGGIIRDIIREVAGEFAKAFAEAKKEELRLRILERVGQQYAAGGEGAGGSEGGPG
ncbi:MAG: hypothetical protein QXJ59_07190 [Thermofilaceae archaeon]